MNCRMGWGLWGVLGVVMIAGCGGSDRGQLPPTYQVTGVVTYQGEPLADALVQFQRTDATRGAVGKTDANGRYQLSTFGSNDGAVAGPYAIAISKYSTPPPDFPVRQHEDDTSVPEFKPENLLPPKYARIETSDLSARVEEQANEIDFDLE